VSNIYIFSDIALSSNNKNNEPYAFGIWTLINPEKISKKQEMPG
jgi:hypothetical protein